MAYQRWRSLRYLCFAGAFGILLGSLVRWRHWHWFRFAARLGYGRSKCTEPYVGEDALGALASQLTSHAGSRLARERAWNGEMSQ